VESRGLIARMVSRAAAPDRMLTPMLNARMSIRFDVVACESTWPTVQTASAPSPPS
jgi:hypothetical protein